MRIFAKNMGKQYYRYKNLAPRGSVQTSNRPITAGSWAWFRASNAFTDYIPADEDAYWDRLQFFLSIPKNATTTISNLFALDHYLGHLQADQYPERVRPLLKTVVRNPYDRLVSAYCFMVRGGFFNNPEYARIAAAYLDFEDWVLRGLSAEMCARPRTFETNGWREPFLPQCIWLTSADDKQLLIPRENIARFENLVPDVRRVFGFEIREQHNASVGRNRWQSYYTNPAVRKKVAEIYAEDFALLGYTTELL